MKNSFRYKMADILKPVIIGSAEIDIMDYTQKELGFNEILSGLERDHYARLKINGETMMSETPMELRTNFLFVSDAYGDVLIGGLGIGLILMAIQDKENIRSITVLEKNPDVIAAVAPQLPLNSKVRIIEADVYDWKPDRKFDCVYMDIWAHINREVYEEMKKLKRKYAHYLKPLAESPRRFNRCWAEIYAKNECRLF